MNEEEKPFNTLTNTLGFLCKTKQDKQNLQYLNEWVRYLDEDNGVVRVVLQRREWHVLTISPKELLFSFTAATSLEEALAYPHEADVCSERTNWHEPWDWLDTLGVDLDHHSHIKFILGTPFGCYFSSLDQMVFVDRDDPEAGVARLTGKKKVNIDDPHPFSEFKEAETSSLFLKVVRYFLEKDRPVLYNVSIIGTQHRLHTIKELRSLMSIELNEAKAMVDGRSKVAQKRNREAALKLIKQLESIGAVVTMSEEVVD